MTASAARTRRRPAPAAGAAATESARAPARPVSRTGRGDVAGVSTRRKGAGPASPPTEALLPHLRRARDLADRDYAEPLDLDALAAAAGCSRYHFLRSFRAAYGETPGRYLSRRRVERATELLRSTTLTVTEVCFLVGFSSLGSFSTRFTELVGMSPSAYRQAAVAAGGPPPVPGCFVLMWTRPGSAIREKPPAAGPL